VPFAYYFDILNLSHSGAFEPRLFLKRKENLPKSQPVCSKSVNIWLIHVL